MKALLAVTSVALSLTACAGSKPFQPPLAAFQVWHKPGVSNLGIKKALLECGMPHPESESLPPKPMRTDNERAETENCLLAAGYRMPADYSHGCTLRPDLPACQPGVKPPTPSVERRMNSNYCRARQDREFCRKTVSNPSACTGGPIEPECVP